MKIYSMTATFGKLDNETITFREGLNVIEAPNEWGKSTWCAFLVAMLYGISTREHSKTGYLADKEHYAPWSGKPMAGRIDLHWDGRDITIERSSTARVPFGEFRAYETASNLPVRELTAANCGLQLLGVEKEVFLRSAFLRLKDLPVTADDTLRRRLNSLVTTGDENNACDDLQEQLKNYKNACYSNRSNGLLPQVHAQADELEQKIQSLQELQVQIRYTQQRQEAAEQELSTLQNHMAALKYEASRTYHEKLSAAQTAQQAAAARLSDLKITCEGLPELSALQQKLTYLQSLGEQRSGLRLKLDMLPQPPQLPQVSAPYMGATPDTALEQVQLDLGNYNRLSAKAKKKGLLLAGILAIALGAAGALVNLPYALYAGIGVGILGVALLIAHFAARSKAKKLCAVLQAKYASAPPAQWIAAAERYVAAQREYMQLSQEHQAKHEALVQQITLLEQTIAQSTDGAPLAEKQQRYQQDLRHLQEFADAQKEAKRCDDFLQALQSSYQECPPPQQPDDLLLSEDETQHKIAALQVEQKQLQLKLGQFQGQANSLGQEAHLQAQLTQVRTRIAKLEQHYKALQYALDLLDTTKKELQRRFAPQITNRAQTLMGAMTGGRYNRVNLEHDLTLCAATDGETLTRNTLWRSDGTVDQLYLALRLAVSEELLPDAPFILDDALVRFDDIRLRAALDLLQQTAENKQVILFTCQSRENRLLNP